MPWKVTTAPAAEPVTTAEAKTHMRIDIADEDAYIDTLITAARVYGEQYTHRAFITQTITYVTDSFPTGGDPIALPMPDLLTVTSLKYYDTDETQQTWNASNYVVNDYELPGQVELATDILWPDITTRFDAVEVIYTAGYGATAADVPSDIKHAIKLLVAHWHENRESVVLTGTPKEVPVTVDALLAPYRYRESF